MSCLSIELKKSMSDSDKSLKSYGAVQDTEWSTEKGEGYLSFFKTQKISEDIPLKRRCERIPRGR